MKTLEELSAVYPAMAMTIALALADVSRAEVSTSVMQTLSNTAVVHPSLFAGNGVAVSLDMARTMQAPVPDAADTERRAIIKQDET